MAKQKRKGHPTSFTAEQNKLLRASVCDLKKARDLSQVALGEMLGVSQQRAGEILSSPRAGFSYGSATKLVVALGFAGVDDFFARSAEAHRGAA